MSNGIAQALAFRPALREEDAPEADTPATEDEIRRLTGESEHWLPPLEEWVLLAAIAALIFVAHAVGH